MPEQPAEHRAGDDDVLQREQVRRARAGRRADGNGGLARVVDLLAPGGLAGPYNDINQSALAKYLSSSKTMDTQVLTCPSDLTDEHRVTASGRPPYPFSYSMNGFIAANNSRNDPNPANRPAGRDYLKTITQVRNNSLKVWFVDESESTINDGLFAPDPGAQDVVASRHEVRRKDGNGLDSTVDQTPARARARATWSTWTATASSPPAPRSSTNTTTTRSSSKPRVPLPNEDRESKGPRDHPARPFAWWKRPEGRSQRSEIRDQRSESRA